MKYSRWVFFVIVVIVMFYLSIYGAGSSVKKEYFMAERPDGGYSLNIVLSTRYWKLITAEGIFPSLRRSLTIELTGKGTDWSYRNQKGYYYSFDEIKSIQKEWDFGYAWISDDRKHVYLNMFWVNAPDRVTSSDVNGRYEIQKKQNKSEER